MILKHLWPTITGGNVLHIDSTYELWIDVLAGITLQKNTLAGDFSWVSCPELPATSLAQMREFNTNCADKVFIGEENKIFKARLEKLPKKYLAHIAPMVLGSESSATWEQEHMGNVIDKVKLKLTRLNEFIIN